MPPSWHFDLYDGELIEIRVRPLETDRNSREQSRINEKFLFRLHLSYSVIMHIYDIEYLLYYNNNLQLPTVIIECY